MIFSTVSTYLQWFRQSVRWKVAIEQTPQQEVLVSLRDTGDPLVDGIGSLTSSVVLIDAGICVVAAYNDDNIVYCMHYNDLVNDLI